MFIFATSFANEDFKLNTYSLLVIDALEVWAILLFKPHICGINIYNRIIALSYNL